jgi:hypothetical protein
MNATLEGYLTAQAEAQDDARAIALAIARLKRDLTKFETVLVGAKERERKASEAIYAFRSQEVRTEITSREVEIAYMKGIILHVGDSLTNGVKGLLRDSGMSVSMQTRIARV